MKTTVVIRDEVLRRAKARAASRGISLRQFIDEALEERLRRPDEMRGRPVWKELGGALRSLRSETLRIQSRVDEEFERIDVEE